ncbi:phosphatidylserine decarboxylase [Nocardiopsis algeriensis]|uniref:Phosphatidylserine decarboxylase n=1 Tax=Nocardiopsis algeriensis TaxID=1478215 RepID=A0A841ITF7_9ACTN|nr:phosphatidylserine decarboxylase [Nocardiopsis algeriensis]
MGNDVVGSIDGFVALLKKWYESDYGGFATLYDEAVKHAKPLPEDTPEEVRYDWRGKTIDDLCDFFREWYKWEPGVSTGLEYIEKFSWINYENDYGMVFVTSGPGYRMTALFTALQGRYMDSEESLGLVRKWEKALGPKMDDYVVPPGGYKNFNDFFVREVKEGKRPVDAPDDASVVVAPADCVINMIVDELAEETRIPVKTVTMNIRQLLDGSDYADRFVGGTAVSCILMPNMYHRYHAPVAGRVVEARDDIGGVYYGMRNFPELLNKGNVGYGYDYSMFEHFRRGYLVIDTGDAGNGCVGMVPVGLNSIASVEFKPEFSQVTPQKPVSVEKGQEIGFFKYGGSLNILLFEEGKFPALQMLQGQRIGTFEDPKRTRRLFSGSWRTPSLHWSF